MWPKLQILKHKPRLSPEGRTARLLGFGGLGFKGLGFRGLGFRDSTNLTPLAILLSPKPKKNRTLTSTLSLKIGDGSLGLGVWAESRVFKVEASDFGRVAGLG